jgi:hypothetical protein
MKESDVSVRSIVCTLDNIPSSMHSLVYNCEVVPGCIVIRTLERSIEDIVHSNGPLNIWEEINGTN